MLICFSLSSCIFGSSSRSHLDEILQGTWRINNELRLVTFEDTIISSEILFGVPEFKGSFKLNLIPDDPSRWVWEDRPEHILSINWRINKVSGDMVYIKHLPADTTLRETIVVTGFPFSKNKLDTLYKVQVSN